LRTCSSAALTSQTYVPQFLQLRLSRLKLHQICKCVDCFPGPLGTYLKHFLCDSELDGKVTDTISYVDFSYVGESDLFIQGYRVSITKLQHNQG
jgi:hypothetical protein